MDAMRFPVVLFDLDGTLIDSASIILASFRHATSTVLGRELPDDELLATVGQPLTEQMRILDATRADELVRVYREHNEPLHHELETCQGIVPVLDRLRDEGRTLGVVTAKRRATVQLAFDRLGIEDYFDVVVGADDSPRHKPNPDPILLALELLEARPQDAVYVGDAPFDIIAAKAAGVHSVAVTWGRIHRRERLLEERPDDVVDCAEDLLGVL
jgi:pyrophosphatase PpaX